MTVTRDVVSDLWPLYASGEASADTRALVEGFLATDPSFAAMLGENGDLTIAGGVPALPPGHELVSLERARRKLWGFSWCLMFAMMFSMMAFGRIISDTSFDVSPRPFIAVASLAVVSWTGFCVSLYRMRARILVAAPRKPAAR